MLFDAESRPPTRLPPPARGALLHHIPRRSRRCEARRLPLGEQCTTHAVDAWERTLADRRLAPSGLRLPLDGETSRLLARIDGAAPIRSSEARRECVARLDDSTTVGPRVPGRRETLANRRFRHRFPTRSTLLLPGGGACLRAAVVGRASGTATAPDPGKAERSSPSLTCSAGSRPDRHSWDVTLLDCRPSGRVRPTKVRRPRRAWFPQSCRSRAP